MDLDEAVALLAGTTVITSGSRLDEARTVVLGDLERLRADERRRYPLVAAARDVNATEGGKHHEAALSNLRTAVREVGTWESA